MITTKTNLIIAFIVWAVIAVASIGTAQAQFSSDSTTYTLSGTAYKVQIGSKGGKYIIKQDGTKYYPPKTSSTLCAPMDAKTIVYKSVTYNIVTGPKGGRYFVYNGTKKYIKVC